MSQVNHKYGNFTKHSICMALCCIIPMALIGLLPLFGVSRGISFAIGMTLMVAIHIYMMKGSKRNSEMKNDKK